MATDQMDHGGHPRCSQCRPSQQQAEAAGLQSGRESMRMEPPCARFKAHRRRIAALGGILDAKRYSKRKTPIQGSGRSRAIKQSFFT